MVTGLGEAQIIKYKFYMKLRTWMRLVQLEAVLIQIGKSELDLSRILRSCCHAVLPFC